MLKWIARTAKYRTEKGRIALIENSWWSKAWYEDAWKTPENVEDPMTGEPFDFIRTDQCMFGQKDADTGELNQAATAWATASRPLKDTLSRLCDKEHSHQTLLGSNSKGRRTAQKATYPEELAMAIVVGIDQHLKEENLWHAFPAQLREEISDCLLYTSPSPRD